MSSYQARQRAIRAERAAMRCEQMVEEMRRECHRHERQHYEETAERFRLQHAHMEQQMKWLMDAVVDVKKCQAQAFLVNP